MKFTRMRIIGFGVILCFALVGLEGCKGFKKGSKAVKQDGQLRGVAHRVYKPTQPYGMVYIPSGTFHMGPSDQDVNYAFTARNKAVSIQGFYMDNTEITNNEYRQFVEWVRDSIAHKILGHVKGQQGGDQYIDWKQKINWNDKATLDKLDAMIYTPENRLWGRKDVDVHKLIYHAEYDDLKEAAQRLNKDKPRSQFIKKMDIPIYPDTLSWIRDFTYSYNEPMTKMYFWHPAFDDYPVVGVNWKQAYVFCIWRTRLWENYRNSKKLYTEGEFRLPFEAEWEYAARGGREQAPYPWGGPYLRNKKGCLLANFKPGRGNYPEDGGFYTVRADAYWPNDYGLYNMAGNVAEWTNDIFYENANSFTHDMNPNISFMVGDSAPPKMKRKVVRGGSWKDVGYYLQNGTRSYEYQDTAKSYIGFRCVITFLGRSKNDFSKRK